MSSGKSKTMPMQIFWGVEAVYYGIVQVENSEKCVVGQARSLISPSRSPSSSNICKRDLTSSILNEREICFASEIARYPSDPL